MPGFSGARKKNPSWATRWCGVWETTEVLCIFSGPGCPLSSQELELGLSHPRTSCHKAETGIRNRWTGCSEEVWEEGRRYVLLDGPTFRSLQTQSNTVSRMDRRSCSLLWLRKIHSSGAWCRNVYQRQEEREITRLERIPMQDPIFQLCPYSVFHILGTRLSQTPQEDILGVWHAFSILREKAKVTTK